jgi:hypothetical protein
MAFTKDFFEKYTKKPIYELPHEIEVTVIDTGWSDRRFTRRIKFVWENGLGYPEKYGGCTYCSMISGNLLKLPDGTEIRYCKGETNLVDIMMKASGPELKLAVSDEIEFMDI